MVFFPQELKEAKVRELLTPKKYSVSAHGYGLHFTQPCYDPEMDVYIRSRTSLFGCTVH